MKTAHTIDRLHERTREYDTVITLDSALADGLNARLERPVIGVHAITPRGLVYERHPAGTLPDRGELFLDLADRLQPDWTHLRRTLDRVLFFWQETGTLEGYETLADYGARDPLLEPVVEYLQSEPSIFRAMERVDPPTDSTVIVEPEMFTGLDTSCFPEDYESVSYLDNSETDPDPFQIYPSADELLRSVVDVVQRTNPHRVGVVVDPDGPYQASLVGRLLGNDIPVMRDKTLDGSSTWRTFRLLLSLRSPEDSLPAGEAKPLLNSLGIPVSISAREFLAERIPDTSYSELRDRVADSTPGELVELLDRRGSPWSVEHLEELSDCLENLEVLDRTLDDRLVRRISFYIRSYPPEVDTSGSGVLLADPGSVTFLDRDLILHIGLDGSWDLKVPDEPWLSSDDQHRRHHRSLQVLLQQGDERFYLVQDHRGSQEIQPALTLDELFGIPLEEFSDYDHEYRRFPGAAPAGSPFEPLPEDQRLTPEPIETFSQSGLARFSHSPRDAMFSRVLPSVDSARLAWGRCFHEFAEFYLNHPDFTENLEEEKWLDPLTEGLEKFISDDRLRLIRTRIRLGARRFIKQFRNRIPEAGNLTGYSRIQRPNPLAEYFDRELDRPFAEAWFDTAAVGLRGQVDLILPPTTLIDFKTGSSKSPSKLLESRDLEDLEGQPDFQALTYLTHHRHHHPDQQLTFEFHYLFKDLAGDWDAKPGMYDEVSITYYPRSFTEQIPQQETFDYLRSTSNKRAEILTAVGYPSYHEFFTEHEVNLGVLKDKQNRDHLEQQLTDLFVQSYKSTKTVRKQGRITLNKLIKFHKNNLFEPDLDRFKKFVFEQIQAYNQDQAGRFPVLGVVDELDEDRLENPDLLLETL